MEKPGDDFFKVVELKKISLTALLCGKKNKNIPVTYPKKGCGIGFSVLNVHKPLIDAASRVGAAD